MSANSAILKNLHTDALPDVLHFDTNFLIKALIVLPPAMGTSLKKRRESSHASNFLLRVRNEKKIFAIYVSVITEFWNTALSIEICREYNLNSIHQAVLRLKSDPSTINQSVKRRMRKRKESFETLIHGFECLFVIESCEPIHKLAYGVMEKYHISFYDAVHIAAMQYGKEKNFVSYDKDFDRCHDINVWKVF